jgi:hypothetical protein
MSSSTGSWNYNRRPKTAAERYRERRLRRRLELDASAVFPLSVAQIADRDNLYACYQELRDEHGQAPGVDGITYADLSNSEAGAILGHLSAAVLGGSYRPRPTRPVSIPKPGTNKTRTLRLGVIADRVVGLALHKAMTPLWEGTFLDCSWGFRPDRSAWGMLAALEVQMVRFGHWVLAVDDIKGAFDHVPINPTLDCHRRLLGETVLPDLSEEEQVRAAEEKALLLDLIDIVLRGSDPTRTRGIDQGGPYSPMALNALLHHYLDRPLSGMIVFPCWFRYADNLCYAGPDVPAGGKALDQVRRLLRPLGMTLKQVGGGVFDLAQGEEAQLLGFTLRRQGGKLVYGLGNQALDQLRQHLSEAHLTQDPPTAAKQSVFGWISSAGPACESGEAVIPMILDMAAEYSFRELATPMELWRLWEESGIRWQDVRKDAGLHGGIGG